ncbi:PepSY domain-containing protein [Shewanella sp. VB17]|uniref:PepSY domain-containing protein n=1 Tax=Shewanella sp. VB17 TaxID=2739432 RepID=UPI001566F786|nr:PepSY domain-containing protein [Shewanella sp. VB17]NRD75282.1 PepSY domain-containing protein [Shewanella sp. VB17]
MKLILFIMFYVSFVCSVSAATRVEVDNSQYEYSDEMSIKSLLSLGENYSFISTVKLDINNVEINRHQEFYKNIPVYATNIVSKKATGGNVVSISGNYYQNIEQDLADTDAFLLPDDAFDIALRHLGITDDMNVAVENKHNQLIIDIDSDLSAYLAYQVSFFLDIDGPSRPFFSINADTGKVLDSWDGIAYITSCDVETKQAGGLSKLYSRSSAVLNAFFEESMNYYPVLLEATHRFENDRNEANRIYYEKSRIRYGVILDRYSKAHQCVVNLMQYQD